MVVFNLIPRLMHESLGMRLGAYHWACLHAGGTDADITCRYFLSGEGYIRFALIEIESY